MAIVLIPDAQTSGVGEFEVRMRLRRDKLLGREEGGRDQAHQAGVGAARETGNCQSSLMASDLGVDWDFAGESSTHWVAVLDAMQSSGTAAVAVCMGEEKGGFERGGGKPLLVFYYGRLIEWQAGSFLPGS